jgi:hypothetical protein
MESDLASGAFEVYFISQIVKKTSGLLSEVICARPGQRIIEENVEHYLVTRKCVATKKL